MSTCNNSPLIRSLQAAALQMSTQLLRTCTRSSPLHDHAELLLTYPRSCSLQVNSTHIKVVQRDRTPESSTSVKRLLCMHQQPPDPLTMPNMVGATACPLPSNPPPRGPVSCPQTPNRLPHCTNHIHPCSPHAADNDLQHRPPVRTQQVDLIDDQ
jgi:hypothetical protein